jgi:hypothetical protein
MQETSITYACFDCRAEFIVVHLLINATAVILTVMGRGLSYVQYSRHRRRLWPLPCGLLL